MTPAAWKDSLAAFFAERAQQIDSVPTLEDLCYIAGRDPRVWREPEVYDDLISSIVELLHVDSASTVLEVGCAAGFLAKGVAPRVGTFIGVDVAKPTLRVAKRLRLPNATFRPADGSRLPLDDNQVDAAFCYDVFTNFPRFDDGIGIIEEMVRVVRPGGHVLVGSIPDEATSEAYAARTAAVATALEAKFGPAVRPTISDGGVVDKVRRWLKPSAPPQVTCYYFRAEDFLALGRRLGVDGKITNIHRFNPYEGYRFNVAYTKPSR